MVGQILKKKLGQSFIELVREVKRKKKGGGVGEKVPSRRIELRTFSLQD